MTRVSAGLRCGEVGAVPTLVDPRAIKDIPAERTMVGGVTVHEA